jgi:hypothetical protein
LNARIRMGTFSWLLALCLVCPALALVQDGELQRGREALSQSDFAGALAASARVSDPLDACRLRMDTLYAAGDMAGALGAATELMNQTPGDPHGAYMTSRLAFDLGLVDLGQVALDSFFERLATSRTNMPAATVAWSWYEGKGEELRSQALLLEGRAAAEQQALSRAQLVVALFCLLLILVVLRMGQLAKKKVQ